MGLLAVTCLGIVHVFYALHNAILALVIRHTHVPRPLKTKRRRIPSHLALILTSDDGANEEDVQYVYERAVRDLTRWCRSTGISRLSIYDPRDVLEGSLDVLASLLNATSPVKHDLFLKSSLYPPTPPLSDASGSRPLSPEPLVTAADLSVTTLCIPRSLAEIDTPPFKLHVLSSQSSLPALVEVTKALSRQESELFPNTPSTFKLSVTQLEETLEGPSGFSAPDLMIVHHCSPSQRSRMPLELHGFPPWQIRLTEIHHDDYAATYWRWLMPWRRSHIIPLSEVKVRNALDEYTGAEFRLGK